MKKVLFASTALVAFAGAASADISFSGTAEMGMASTTAVSLTNPFGARDTAFFQSLDFFVDMTGTTDNGLTFGASIDLADAIDGSGGSTTIVDNFGSFADYTVFISGQFGTLTMGDTDGAIDANIVDAGNIGNPGSIADNETGHAGYNGFGGELDSSSLYNGQNLRYDYSIAGFSISVSAQIDGNPVRDGSEALQIGVSYELDFGGGSVDFGLGYGEVTDTNILFGYGGFGGVPLPPNTDGDQGFSLWAGGIAAFFDNGLSMGFTYTDVNDSGFFGGNGQQWGVGLGYTWEAFSIGGNWGEYDWDSTARVADSSGWGIAAAYDLGGGLLMNFGYGDSQYGDNNQSNGLGIVTVPGGGTQVIRTDDFSSWSFGLVMEF
jgi:outer membrane protein OmpU